MNNYFNNVLALGIEKGKWIMIFIAGLIASNLITGLIIDKKPRNIIYIIISAVFTSVLTFTFLLIEFNDVYLYSILLGLAAGISPVAWGKYFSDNVSPEERGRVMGIAVGLVMPIAQLFLLIEPIEIISSIDTQILLIGIWLLITLLIIPFNRKKPESKSEKPKKRKGHRPKQIILYSIPVFLFYVVSGILLSMVLPTIQDNLGTTIIYLIWAIPFLIGAIIGGIQLDVRGRKFPTMVGLAITGVSLAIFGILDLSIGYLFIIPLSFGFGFVVISSFIIWADLAPGNSTGTFYGLGFALINAAQMVGLIIAGVSFGTASISQINTYIFFASVALFICIPPLILAEEALPRALIEKRQLMEYLDGVKDKFTKKK
jgi:MFS family permease